MRLAINILFLSGLYSCNSSLDSKKINEDYCISVNHQFEQNAMMSSVVFDSIRLELLTVFIKDSLRDDDSRELFRYPIIEHQTLSFYINDSLKLDYAIPIYSKEVWSVNHGKIDISIASIYKLCLFQSQKDNKHYVLVKGADFCFGENCEEFLGIYSIYGEIIFEGYSVNKTVQGKYKTIAKATKDMGIDLKDCIFCSDIDSALNEVNGR